jgi:hypothetical protein
MESRPPEQRRRGAHRDPGVSGIEVEEPGKERAEAGADLSRRTLATPGAARADGDGRRHNLDKWNSGSDSPWPVVEGSDGCVRPVPFRFRSEPEHDDARDEAAEAHDYRQHPRPSGIGDRLGPLAQW